MPRPEKVQAVEEIRGQLDEARATFVTEYRGLTVSEQQQLRRNIQKAQGEYRVLKMSLARLAVADMPIEGFSELLAGPTALAFAIEDPVPVAKALREFASDHEMLIIKGGILGGALLPPEQISRLAEIESREVLLSKIAGGFKAPMSKLAGLLGAKTRDVASVFSQLLEKKEEEQGPAEVETPAAETEPVTEEAAPTETDVEEEAPSEGADAVDEAGKAPADEPGEAVVEETPTVEAEEVAEAAAEEAPEVAEEPAPEVEDAPAVETEEAPEVEAEEAPAVEAGEAPEVEAEEAPEAKKTTPKKKAAPKAKAKKSSAKAETSTDVEDDDAAAGEPDETAEEE